MDRLVGLDEATLEGRFGGIPFSSSLSELHSKRLAFWTAELQACAIARRLVSLSPAQAASLYARADRGGAVPRGLSRALVELERTGRARSLARARRGVGAVLVEAALSPLRWLSGGGSGGEGDTVREPGPDERFVLEEALAAAGSDVLAGLRGRVFLRNEAETAVRERLAEEHDVPLVMEWLRQHGGLVEAGGARPRTRGSEVWAAEGREEPATELEVAALELKETMRKLEKKEKELEERSRRLREQAREASVVDRNKVKAVALLKRKHTVDEALAKMLEIGTNVAHVLSRVEEMQASQMAFNAYKQGAGAMKAAQIEPEEVSRVLDEFQELETIQDEVTDTFNAASNANTDMEELEKELEAMSLVLPDVPKTKVGADETVPEKTSPVVVNKEKEKKQMVLE